MAIIHFHIGYPKCFSKTIQYYLYKNASRYKYKYHGYYKKDKILTKFLDYHLRFTKRYFFEKDLKIIKNKFNKKYYWLSSENIITNLIPNDIPLEEKFFRVNQVLKNHQISYHIIFRNLKKTILSIFNEFRYQGYTENFVTFLDLLKTDHEASFIKDFCPNFQIQNIKKNIRLKDKIKIYYCEHNKDLKEFFKSNGILIKKILNHNLSINKKVSNSKKFLGFENYGLQEFHRSLISSKYKNEIIYQKITRLKKNNKTNIKSKLNNIEEKKLNEIVMMIKSFDKKFINKNIKLNFYQHYFS